MRFTIALAVVLTVVYGANHMCWSVDQISDEVIRLADSNGDGIVQQNELTNELLGDWNLSNDTCLTYHDFMTNWMLHFHDHHDTAHAFFKNLDYDNDQHLCLGDVAIQVAKYDMQPTDGQIQPIEFKTFMHAVHPDSHQNHGHGHGC